MHWNPQLVAQLEAERAQGLPRRNPKPVIDTTEDIEKRRQLAMEMAHHRTVKAV